jgi:hypothetical protein
MLGKYVVDVNVTIVTCALNDMEGCFEHLYTWLVPISVTTRFKTRICSR